MANLTITASNVQWVSGPIAVDQLSLGVINAGNVVAQNADGSWQRARCDGSAILAGQLGLGVALASSDATNARISIALPGAILTLGTGTAGIIYCCSATIGAWAPSADLVSTNKTTIVGIGIGGGQVQLVRGYNGGAII